MRHAKQQAATSVMRLAKSFPRGTFARGLLADSLLTEVSHHVALEAPAVQTDSIQRDQDIKQSPAYFFWFTLLAIARAP